MAKGRRLALSNQAMLVWSEQLDLHSYLETGSFTIVSHHLAPNPLADKIIADIAANGGRLIVNEQRFAELAQELT